MQIKHPLIHPPTQNENQRSLVWKILENISAIFAESQKRFHSQTKHLEGISRMPLRFYVIRKQTQHSGHTTLTHH